MSDVVDTPQALLSWEEAKTHLRLDGDDEREYVLALVDAASRWCADTEVRWSGSVVPQPVKQAALLLVGQWYASRENAVTGTIATELPMAVAALLAPYRGWRV